MAEEAANQLGGASGEAAVLKIETLIFLVGGRCTLYFVAHTAAVDKCPGELWVPTLCEVHAALDGTFGVAVVLERREGKEHMEVNLVHILLGG